MLNRYRSKKEIMMINNRILTDQLNFFDTWRSVGWCEKSVKAKELRNWVKKFKQEK